MEMQYVVKINLNLTLNSHSFFFNIVHNHTEQMFKTEY